MASGSKKHVHKYMRAPLGYRKVWRCAFPDCNHFMPPHLESLVEGRTSICWECSEVMVLNPMNMELDRPTCESCRVGDVKELTEPTGKLAEILNRKVI